MSKRFPFDTVLERGDDGLNVRVIYSMTPPVPARLYGDYPQPAEGGEIEIISVTSHGKPVHLTEAEEEALLEECLERSGDDWAEEQAAAMEWRAQCRRDDEMMERWERSDAE